MATLNRKDEVDNFIGKLLIQTYKNFELLIIDQNPDDSVRNIYFKYKDKIDIKYIRSDRKGLSFNRNTGLDNCSGDIIAFPDDDCEYTDDTLEKAVEFFNNNPNYCFYTCNTRDKNTPGAILNTKTKNTGISIFNFTNTGISFTVFTLIAAIKNFKFDEKLGVGTKFGSGEESDLLLFLLRNRNKGKYHAGHYIFHPAKEETAEKALLYGMGFGAVYKKAIIKYKYFVLFPVFILRLLKGIINIVIHGNKKMRIASLYGRMQGFVQYKISASN
ncbi:MAG: glycosyltransferase family 2 protein, partial [Treponema sp.]|jgi:glycosyltransferase involved in cell wall biosynthesis|nr:glycosyltransferase family 2 protein [Treponema sp.]